MIRNKPWLWMLIGALLGFFVIHPLLMIAAQAMSPKQDIRFGIQVVFSLVMLPWALGFAGMGSLSAWLLAKTRLALIEEKKFQGAMELARAACHELNQPMQVILSCSEIISIHLEHEDPLRGYFDEMIAQIAHMDRILKKIRWIKKYETSQYLKGVQIIDIDKASGHY
jgi:signal transduction histidine kinase